MIIHLNPISFILTHHYNPTKYKNKNWKKLGCHVSLNKSMGGKNFITWNFLFLMQGGGKGEEVGVSVLILFVYVCREACLTELVPFPLQFPMMTI